MSELRKAKPRSKSEEPAQTGSALNRTAAKNKTKKKSKDRRNEGKGSRRKTMPAEQKQRASNEKKKKKRASMLSSLMNRRLNAENAESSSSIAENSGAGKRPDSEPLRFSPPQRKALTKNDEAPISTSDAGRKKKEKGGRKAKRGKVEGRHGGSTRLEKTQDSRTDPTQPSKSLSLVDNKKLKRKRQSQVLREIKKEQEEERKAKELGDSTRNARHIARATKKREEEAKLEELKRANGGSDSEEGSPAVKRSYPISAREAHENQHPFEWRKRKYRKSYHGSQHFAVIHF